MIPKIIHFIWWQGEDQLPDKYKPNVIDWARNNPSYELMFWDESKIRQLCHDHFPQYEENFNQSQHIMEQIDVSKFMMLEVYGGVYVDTDIESRRPIPEDWIKYKAVFSELYSEDICSSRFCLTSFVFSMGHSGKDLYNSGFYAGEPGTGIFGDILAESMKLRLSIPRWVGKQIYITYTAGPPFITIYIQKYFKTRSDIKILTPTFIESCGTHFHFSKNESDCLITEDTVGIHKHGLSWASPVHFFVLKCLYHRKYLYSIILILVGIIGLIWWWYNHRK